MKKVYLCLPSDECIEREDILVLSGYSEEAVENHIAEMISKEDFFREYVSDPAINMSFSERFYHVNGKYLFDMHMDRAGLPADWVMEQANGDSQLALLIVHETFIELVEEFFGEEKQFAEDYIKYVTGVEDVEFSDEFYFYVAKHDKEWNTYEIHEIGYEVNPLFKLMERVSELE